MVDSHRFAVGKNTDIVSFYIWRLFTPSTTNVCKTEVKDVV